MKLTFFPNPQAFRRWLQANHRTATELWVGFYKKDAGRPSITWSEAVDEALCFGWIDGIRKSVDEISYTNRFTPRKPTSNWSTVNIGRVKALKEAGRMTLAGMEAFEKRVAKKSGVYSYEQRKQAKLPPAIEARFKKNWAAWKYFEAQPPGYRQLAIVRVMSAVQEATRERRLQQLMDYCAAGRRMEPMAPLDKTLGTPAAKNKRGRQ